MRKKRIHLTGNIKCNRLPYPGCGKKKKPKPTGAVALLLEFIRLDAIGGKKRNPKKIQDTDGRDALLSLAKISPLLLNLVSLVDWKAKKLDSIWINILEKYGFPRPVKKKKVVIELNSELVKILSGINKELAEHFSDTLIGLHNFTFSALIEDDASYVQVMDNINNNFKQIHRLLYYLLGPVLVLPEHFFFKRIKNGEIVLLPCQIFFADAEYDFL